MKLKIFVIGLLTLFVTFHVILASASTDSSNTQSVSDDSKWLKNHRRTKKLVREGIHLEISAEGSSITGTIDVAGKAEITFIWVECCKFTNEEFYWCDAALQDKRC